MSQKDNVELYSQILFLSDEEIAKKKLPARVTERIGRIRQTYNYWCRYPQKSEKEIRDYIMAHYDLQMTVAYQDFWLIKTLLGSFQQSSRDYHRWRFNTLIMEQYNRAAEQGDVKSAIAALNAYAKFNKLDAPDDVGHDYDLIAPQTFEPSSDPTTIGIKPVKNLDTKVRELIKRYNKEDLDAVEVEEPDFDYIINPDEAFKPLPGEQLSLKFDGEDDDDTPVPEES